MKTCLLALVLTIVGVQANAKLLDVRFVPCQNENYLCAEVDGYDDPMPITTHVSVGADRVWRRIDGTVQRVHEFGGGNHYQLEINSFDIPNDPNIPRPRGF